MHNILLFNLVKKSKNTELGKDSYSNKYIKNVIYHQINAFLNAARFIIICNTTFLYSVVNHNKISHGKIKLDLSKYLLPVKELLI